MKVALINSPLFRENNPLYDEDSLPPLGLGYIATHLQQHGIEVELIDAVHQRIALQDLIASLNYLKPEFVATNIFTTNYKLVKELIESLTFETHIIIGGLSTKELHTSIISWETNNHIDVVIGDGELITLDIVNSCVTQAPIVYAEKFRVFQIDKVSAYYVTNISDLPLNRKFFLNEPVKHLFGFTEANIVASRGCIYNCKFCAAAQSLNREYGIRERSEESLARELREIQTQYPEVNSIRVLDDLFLKTNKSVDAAIRVFSQFQLQWRSMAHVMTFQNVQLETVVQLRRSGCRELFIGIESGSPKILSSINKTSNLTTIVTNLTKVFKGGIDIKGYFIYGFPGETEEDMAMTLSLAKQLKAIADENGVNFRTSVFQYRPYHATEIYYQLKAQGKDMNVEQVDANEALSHLAGRLQFNFHSGNYAAVDLEVVHDYIYRTTNLTNAELYAGLKPQHKP